MTTIVISQKIFIKVTKRLIVFLLRPSIRKKGVTAVKKQTSYYYQPLSYENYDVVVNPSILEPVVQIGMNIRLQYSPKPKEAKAQPVVKTEIKHKYYVVSPNGTLDIKELQTN